MHIERWKDNDSGYRLGGIAILQRELRVQNTSTHQSLRRIFVRVFDKVFEWFPAWRTRFHDIDIPEIGGRSKEPICSSGQEDSKQGIQGTYQQHVADQPG